MNGDASRPDAAAGVPGSPADPEAAAALLEQRLAALDPVQLDIINESHLHAGHAAAQGGCHFRVRIACARFQGLGTLARHRLVYDCVRDLMPYPIHALAIEAGALPT
jgi:BolA protein